MPSRLARWTLLRGRRPLKESHSLLASFPNELLLAILDFMDDKSLHLTAAVSKRFYHLATQSLLSKYDISPSLDSMKLTSPDALRALRIALTLSGGTPKAISYAHPTPTLIPQDIRRIDTVLRRFTTGPSRLDEIHLDFGKNLLAPPIEWTLSKLLPKLLATICGHSQVGLFVAATGLFTTTPKAMLMWNPYTRDPSFKTTMHDGSRQWVPAIRSLRSLHITYPVCTTLAPEQPWTMVVVNAPEIQTLLLSIRLSTPEWAAILSSITLPNLREVGIWAENIASGISIAFLNRHRITTLKYMAPRVEPPRLTYPPLSLPHLRHLTALSQYVVHIFTCRDTPTLFPLLAHVDLFCDAKFHQALRLLALHVPLRCVGLWFLRPDDTDPAAWPVFPHVDTLALNNCDVVGVGARLPALLAHAFPALQRLDMDHSFPKSASGTADSETRKTKAELVNRIARVNPGVLGYSIDDVFFVPP
ncbi:hypothetical protein B0H14DRAFT_3722162 [Mycena olivaceomarginata]|nr:hypothetical protein B0H14DRAFT_3722162 [Mycena olivaceomarginata]